MLRLIILVLGIAAIQARIFNNPVLGNADFREPGAMKANGTYYINTMNMIATQLEKFEIHQSTDLINWKPAGYVFNASYFPSWAQTKNWFMSANIHEVQGNYLIYFNAYEIGTNTRVIGVAVAKHPLGPYIATDRPLLSDPSQQYMAPTLANDNGNLYLMWRLNEKIYGRQLNSNGLSFASDQTIELIRDNLAWENSYIAAPWYKRNGDYHYLMYKGELGLGIARSRNVLGPYEKLPDPILVANNEFGTPNGGSFVKDLDAQSDVIVFQTSQKCAGCNSGYVVNVASIGWDDDRWPYIYDY